MLPRTCCLLILSAAAYAAPVATYTFNNNLSAQQGGVASLTAVDPLGTSNFTTAVVFGNTRNVYHFNGSASPPADQGGLQLDTTGLIGATNYSVEIVFSLDDRDNAWRRILDTLNRASDSGLYIDPSNHLDVYPVGGTSDNFTPSTFFDVFVTVDSSDNIVGYFGGVQQFTLTSNVLENNSNLLSFFLDNTAGGGQGEWSQGNVALIKVFNSALSAGEVARETEDPFVGTTTPEPASWLLMLGGAVCLGIRKLRRA